jgi:hypothetical protein
MVFFRKTFFGTEVVFRGTNFKDSVLFRGRGQNRLFGPQATVNFREAELAKPQQVRFTDIALRPDWFVGADVRELNFAFGRLKWHGVPQQMAGDIDEEVEKLRARDDTSPHGQPALSVDPASLTPSE